MKLKKIPFKKICLCHLTYGQTPTIYYHVCLLVFIHDAVTKFTDHVMSNEIRTQAIK